MRSTVAPLVEEGSHMPDHRAPAGCALRRLFFYLNEAGSGSGARGYGTTSSRPAGRRRFTFREASMLPGRFISRGACDGDLAGVGLPDAELHQTGAGAATWTLPIAEGVPGRLRRSAMYPPDITGIDGYERERCADAL